MSKDNKVDYYSSKEKSHEVVKKSVHVKELPISRNKYQDKVSAVSDKKEVLKKVSKVNSRAKKISQSDKTSSNSSKSTGSIKKNKLNSSTNLEKSSSTEEVKKSREGSERKTQDNISSIDNKIKPNKEKIKLTKNPHQRFLSATSRKELLKKQSLNRSKKNVLTSLSGSKGELGEHNEQTEWTDKGSEAAQKSKTIVNQGKKILDNRNDNLIKSFGQTFKKNFRKEKFFLNTKKAQNVASTKSSTASASVAQNGTKAVSKWSSTYIKELLREAFSPKALALKFSVVGGWIGLAVVFIMMLIFFIGGLANSSSQAAKQAEEFNPNASIAERAQTVYNEIKKIDPKATTQGISAFLGNWDVESSINPKRAEGDYLSPPVGAKGDKDPAWDNEKWLMMGGPDIYNGGFPNILHRGLGLGQWTDTSDGSTRNTMLRDYAKKQKKKWYSLPLQIDFAMSADTPYDRALFKAIVESDQSVEALADQVATLWERNNGDKMAQRKEQSRKWFNYFKNGGGSGSSTANIPPEYVGKLKFPNPSSQCSTSGYPGNAYAAGQCTWYVYNRFYQLGKTIPAYLGNGGQWGASASAQGYNTTSTPKAGYAASFPAGVAGAAAPYGHVAFVEYVNPDGSFLVSEMNMNGGLYKITYRVISSPAGVNFIDFKL
ncbi:phage tail tip lysozyme (plasmid) [Lactococcus formosensis]|uniref:phage tail tip lysozyme n=1 Tax=Lactococcus formosensis TaxID=1281486 RepID=UPI0030CC2748